MILSNWIFKSREELWKQGKTKEEVDKLFPMVLNPAEMVELAKAARKSPSVMDCQEASKESQEQSKEEQEAPKDNMLILDILRVDLPEDLHVSKTKKTMDLEECVNESPRFEKVSPSG